MSGIQNRWNMTRLLWRGAQVFGSVYFKVGGARAYARELADAEVGEVILIDSRSFEVTRLVKTKNGRPGVVLARVNREGE